MQFGLNHPIIFVLVGLIIALVLGQSVFFLVKAWKRGIQMGMNKSKLRKIAVSAAIFTIAPAVAIVVSVIALAKDLGVALPWLRLSVVGSLSYETIAASNALTAMGLKFGETGGLSAKQFVTVALVMTISIMVGIWLVPVVCKKLQRGMISLEKHDKKWSDIFSNAMFIGMISAFLGFVFCNVSSVVHRDLSGLIPVCVMAVSAIIMLVAGLLVKIFKKATWISDYALPVSLIGGMASAIPITRALNALTAMISQGGV